MLQRKINVCLWHRYRIRYWQNEKNHIIVNVMRKKTQEFCSNNTRYRKITVIPFDNKEVSLNIEYKNIPFDIDELNKKSKNEILNIYKIIRNKNELNKLPSDFLDNLFECTKKYIRCLLPYEIIKIYKTLNIIKKNNKELNLLLHQHIKRIYKNFDVISISKLFQIYTFSKSKPIYIIKKLSEIFLNNLKNCNKPWCFREVISIYSYFKINSKDHIDNIFKKCVPIIAKNIMMYTPKDATIIFYSFVKMNKYDKILCHAITKNVILKINLYQFNHLSIILNSFAKIGEKNNKLCKVICDHIKNKIKIKMPKNITDLETNNIEQNDINKNCLSNFETQKLTEIKINDSPKDDEAIIELNKNETEYKQIKTYENKNNLLKDKILKPKDVSIILNALIKLEYYNNETFICLIPFIINNICKFSPQSLSNLAHAYSQIHIDNTLLFDKIANESIMKIHKFKNKELSNLANSFVRLNIKNKTLFTYIIDEFLYRSTIGSKFQNYKFDILSLQQFAYSFSKVGLKDEKVYNILYNTLIKKIHEIKKMKKKKIINGEKLLLENYNNQTNSCSDIVINKNTNSLLFRKDEMLEKNNFDFFFISTFVNSYSRAKINHKNFTHFISYIIRKKKQNNNEILSNQSLSSLIYGLTKLKIKDKKIYQLLLKECNDKIDSLQPFQIALILYSFSKLKIYSYKYVKKSIQILSMNIHNLNLTDLSLVCYSLSNFLYRDIIFLYKVQKILFLNNYEFNKTNVSQLFNSYTKLCFYHKPFYDFIFQKIFAFMHEFDEKELTNLVFSFIYYFHIVTLQNHVDLEKNNSSSDSDPNISNLVNGVKYFIENKKNEEIKVKPNASSNNNSNGNSNNNSNSSNSSLGREMCNDLKKKKKIFDEKNKLDNIVNNNDKSCYSLKENTSNLILKNREEFFKNELNIFFNLIFILNEKYRQKLSLISIYQLQIVDLYLRAFFTNYFSFPNYLKSFFFKCRNVKLKIDDYVLLSSKMHRNISRYLNAVGVKHKSEVIFGPYQLDIVVDFLQNDIKNKFNLNFDNEINDNDNDNDNNYNVIYKRKGLANEEVVKKEDKAKYNIIEKLLTKNIVIEVDGISHFYKESYSRTLNSIIKNYILKKFGWNIIHIPYQEWNQCYNFKTKLLYAIHIFKKIVHINRDTISPKDFIYFMNNKNNNDNKNNNTFADVSHINNVNNNFMNHDMVINNNDKNEEDEKNQHHGNINDTNANIQQKDEKNIPDFYTIDEETIFLNQLKCRNKFQKNIMKKLRQDGKMKYDFNIVCKNNKTEECIELSDQISKTDIET
ncbi:heptatricopeptide repeat and RAP domain-containing protein, putative [Plasmodium yoelii]|uniref:Heptatricopeptide repeat and RAP domain-containing protein n=3 Tax=Plasmodium yoelii TaxID=5861 RepID=A0AAF0B3B8_PLAYO|nr:heptatricopeptide repeat and RAP domain-containing protein, putative [Plasmodium yoelii]WBY61047.1 heptatricopeptide repeat and RAP domain-containing protein [Plasmodium yoelii yoelii]CDU20783.1 RAP protein, putative [Plasmodium yoelii]VTZ81746.1 heptatricopeptide repeat and RAP domain-containing protein, putative [Plasmodium yoelii]|eukprot:XP_727427.2 heptatricopeptide repeat and RAP domain-containing protein, putative [Plasmodium yoelii]